MVNFIPDISAVKSKEEIPFFEDVTAKEVRGRHVTRSIEKIQKSIEEIIIKLGGAGVSFMIGKYPGEPERHGYQITFHYGEARGRIDCAALPLKYSNDLKKKDRALAQALFLVEMTLEAHLHSRMYQPGVVPLVPYLLSAEGKTVTELVIERQQLPELATPEAI